MRPSSDRNEMPVVLMEPMVSKARGWKMPEFGRDAYFQDFLAAGLNVRQSGLSH